MKVSTNSKDSMMIQSNISTGFYNQTIRTLGGKYIADKFGGKKYLDQRLLFKMKKE